MKQSLKLSVTKLSQFICFLQAYHTMKGDQQRYQARITELSSRSQKAAAKESVTPIQPQPPGEQLLGTIG